MTGQPTLPLEAPLLHARVHGLPVPQGSIRSLGRGRPSIHSNAATLLPWREHVQHVLEASIREHPDQWPRLGPVCVHAVFTLPKPRSAPKRRRTWPTTRPDLDKLVRAVLDAGTAAGVWHDDAQVVNLHAAKTYPGEHPHALHIPGLYLGIHPIGDQ